MNEVAYVKDGHRHVYRWVTHDDAHEILDAVIEHANAGRLDAFDATVIAHQVVDRQYD